MDFNNMSLQIIYAPNKIFSQRALEVEKIDDELRATIDKMFKTIKIEGAAGIAGNMVGILKRIVVIDLFPGNVSDPICMINPVITYKSEQMQVFEEASISFVGIFAKISRAAKIKVSFLDYNGKESEMEAEGYLSTVIQHEIDYLDGKVFLDHLTKMKRDLLLTKMKKYLKAYPPHIHGVGCNHHH
jgi:peptide deformylase